MSSANQRQEESQPRPPGLLRHLWAVLRQRCPRCLEGRMFRGVFAMNDPCPNCHLLFQREEGYFLGAMYVSYVLGAGLLLPFYFLFEALLPDWNTLLVTVVAMLAYLPFVPVVFRYSRVVWVHFERYSCPSDVSAGTYEKMRLQEIAEAEDRATR